MEYYPAIRKNENLYDVSKLMELEKNLLSEITQRQNKNCVLLFSFPYECYEVNLKLKESLPEIRKGVLGEAQKKVKWLDLTRA